MNLTNLLPNQPNKLAKYPDHSTLIAPVTISVGIPNEKVGFWQSYALYSMMFAMIQVTIILFFMNWWTSFETMNLYELIQEIKVIWTVCFLSFSLLSYWIYRVTKNFAVPNPWIARKLTWKYIPILIINKDSIQLTSQFYIVNKNFQHDKIINYDEVEAFYLNQIRGGTIGFWIDYTETYIRKMKKRGNRVQGLIFNKNIPLCKRHNVLNGLYYIEQREILNIMNTFHKQRTDNIKYLSQDNHDNLMDIGW